MSDDQGYADVGYHNPDCPIPTPNIDKLAMNGIRLENYYVHPTCTPSRAALLTGISKDFFVLLFLMKYEIYF